MRVIQRSEDLRFALKAREPCAIGSEVGRKNLDRDLPLQPRVGCTIDLAHAAGAERAGDLVRTETRSG
jgi:hypothetical protein